MPGSLARPKQPRDILVLLIALAINLFAFQYVTLGKMGVLPPSKSYNTVALYADEVRQFVAFNWADGLLLSLIGALLLAILVLEFRKGRLSLFLGHAFASERRTLLLLGLSSLVLVRFYFAWGELSWGGDASEHICSAHIAAQALAAGELPIWTNYFGAGSPYLQFYGFLFFYAVAFAFLICRDLFISLKLVLATAHVASGIAMYLLARLVCRSRRAGFLAGLGFVVSLWHTQQVVAMGRLPLSIFYALLPLPFYCFERLRSSRSPATLTVVGGIVLGLLTFTHPGYALWTFLFLTLYMALQLWGGRREGLSHRTAACGFGMLAAGLLFGACLALPLWLERGATGLHAGVSLSGIPSPTWRHLLVWSNFRFRLLPLSGSSTHWYGGYLGLSLVMLAVAGLTAPLWQRSRQQSRWYPAAGVCLVGAALLALGYRWPLIRSLPMLHLMSAERYLLFVVFFLALMAGAGAKALSSRWSRRRPLSPTFSLLLLVVLADLAPTTFQHLYGPVGGGNDPTGYPLPMFAPFREQALAFSQRGELPNYRIFWARGQVHPFLATSLLQFNSETPSPHASYSGDLRAVSALTNPFERYLSAIVDESLDPDHALFDSEISDVVAGGLGMLDVKHLLVTQADRVRAFDLPDPTPILVSPRITGLKGANSSGANSGIPVGKLRTLEGLDPTEETLLALWIIRQTQANLDTRTCRRLLLLEYEGEEDLGTQPAVDVLEHHVWNQRVEMRVRTSSDCYARLAYAYFPYLRVEVDGERVSPLQTADRFIALRLGPGDHRITLVPYLSPLRRWLLALDGVLLLAGIWIWRRERGHRTSR